MSYARPPRGRPDADHGPGPRSLERGRAAATLSQSSSGCRPPARRGELRGAVGIVGEGRGARAARRRARGRVVALGRCCRRPPRGGRRVHRADGRRRLSPVTRISVLTRSSKRVSGDRSRPSRSTRSPESMRDPGSHALPERAPGSVAGRLHAGRLDHEDHGPLRRPRAVHDAPRHRVALMRVERHGVGALDVDEQPAPRTRKNSSSTSCLCQWKSPWMTPRRMTASFTEVSVWLNQGSCAAASAPTSMRVLWPNFSSRLMS